MHMSQGPDPTYGGPNRCTDEDKQFYTVFAALLDHEDFRNELSQREISIEEFKRKVRELLQIDIPDALVQSLRDKMALITQTTTADFFRPYGKIRC
jgi:phenylalanine-4-hydroxylase